MPGVGNVGAGIDVTGGSNLLQDNGVLANQGGGIVVSANTNQLVKNLVGDTGKGNKGDGIRLTGYGNTVQENRVFASTGDGINVAGGTSAKPNVIYKNTAGDRGKGNAGHGISVASAGNGKHEPHGDRAEHGEEQWRQRDPRGGDRASAQGQRERRLRRIPRGRR
jgi:hypothetical protein